MFYLLWITYAAIYYILAAVFSKYLNDEPQSWRWFWILMAMNCVGIWPLIARYSKNLIFDGLFYDALIFTVYYATLLWMGAGRGFTIIQWTACGIVCLGLLVLKLG
jgi:hypothetical protein